MRLRRAILMPVAALAPAGGGPPPGDGPTVDNSTVKVDTTSTTADET